MEGEGRVGRGCSASDLQENCQSYCLIPTPSHRTTMVMSLTSASHFHGMKILWARYVLYYVWCGVLVGVRGGVWCGVLVGVVWCASGCEGWGVVWCASGCGVVC